MTRKIISCLLCLLLLPYAAFAGVTTPIDINSETKAFSITGTSDMKNGEILLIVTKPNVIFANVTPELLAGSAAVVYTLETDSQGAYNGQFCLPDEAPSGDYTVYVGSDAPVVFYYADASEIDRCIVAISTASKSNIGSILDYYTNTQKILGLDLGGDYAAYSDAANSVMVDYITASAPTTISAIKDYFVKSTEAGVLVKSTDAYRIASMLESNKTELETDSALSLQTLSDMYLSLRDSSVTTISKIAHTLRCAEALCKINSSTRGVMDSVLTEYNDVLGLSLTGDYASLDKVEINKALTDKNFTSILAVQQAFAISVADVKSQANQNNGSNNSGKVNSTINVSGGISSGSSSSGTVNTVVPPVQAAPTATFSDLGGAEWAADYINTLADKNIINGVGDSRFDPNGTVTREQYVKMLLGAFGIEGVSGHTQFADVDSAMWYAPYIAAAYENDIVSGVSEKEFGIGSAITREQMAVMSVRIMEKYGIELNTAALSFADRAEISSYAYDAVSKLTASGIINGMDSSNFAPQMNLTRAQAAKVIYLIMKAGGYIA